MSETIAEAKIVDIETHSNDSVLRAAMQIHVEDAKSLGSSENEYEQEVFARSLARVREITGYIENGWITLKEAEPIFALMMAKPELAGFVDELSGQFNEHGFNYETAKAIDHAKRTGEDVVMGYFDLIGFKPVNDKVGDDAGDRAIKYTGEYLNAVAYDGVVARIHGDTYAVLFRSAKQEGVEQHLNASVLKDGLAEFVRGKFSEEKDPVDLTHINVRARAGFTSLRPDDSVASFKKRANQDMLDRKSLEPSIR